MSPEDPLDGLHRAWEQRYQTLLLEKDSAAAERVTEWAFGATVALKRAGLTDQASRFEKLALRSDHQDQQAPEPGTTED